MSQILHHTLISAPEHTPAAWLLILHGIYGSGRNWNTIARRLVAARPEWGSILVDLRLHGLSQNFPPPHTLTACAQDLELLVANLKNLNVKAVMGHSFGGKVALAYAQTRQLDLEQIWIIDSTPEARPPAGDAWELLQVLRHLPTNFPSRSAAALAIQAAGYSKTLADWMVTNLNRGEDGWRWQLDFAGLEALLLDFFNTDLWSVVAQPPDQVQLHFVKAQNSSVLSEEAASRISAVGEINQQVFLHYLTGGHWLNVENPAGVVQLLNDQL